MLLSDKALKRIQKHLDQEAAEAKKHELCLGVDPESYTGKEIFRLSREICSLRSEIQEIKILLTKQIMHGK